MPVPTKEMMRLSTWLSVLGELLSAEGARARRRRSGLMVVLSLGSSMR